MTERTFKRLCYTLIVVLVPNLLWFVMTPQPWMVWSIWAVGLTLIWVVPVLRERARR